MKNIVVKTLMFNKQARLYYVDNTSLLSQIMDMNKDTAPVLRQALGTTVSIISLLSATLKEQQRISLQLTMSNRKYKLYADTDANGHVRGYLNEPLKRADPKLLQSMPLESLIGPSGSLRIIQGTPMHSYTGITDMPCRNIVGDLSHYFRQSEQTTTYISTSLELAAVQGVRHSQALFVQLLPGAAPALLDEVRRRIQPEAQFFQELRELNEHSVEHRLREKFADLSVIGQHPVDFHCGCSKEMFYGMLHSLPPAELKQAAEQQKGQEAVCHVCGQAYYFEPSEIKSLLQ